MYQTAAYQGERLEFEEQPKLPEDEGREGASTSRDPGDVSAFRMHNSSDSDSDDFVAEEDRAIYHAQNSELGFPLAVRRTRSGRI